MFFKSFKNNDKEYERITYERVKLFKEDNLLSFNVNDIVDMSDMFISINDVDTIDISSFCKKDK